MPDAPRSATVIRRLVQDYAIHQGKAQLSPAQRGAAMRYLCEAWPDQGVRHQCYGWLFQYPGEDLFTKNSKELADQEIDALRHWIDAQPIGDVWFAGPRFYQEAGFVMAEAVKAFGEQAGQGDLFSQPETEADSCGWTLDDL